MAVGNDTLPALLAVPGVRLGTVSAGIKTAGRRDLVLIEASPGTNCAAVFTQNAFCAAPVTVAREHLTASLRQPRYLLVNTGNANAGTGEPGIRDARACARELASLTQLEAERVVPFSTGVIGESLPVDRICAALPAALEALSESGWEAAAEGILTTDTRPKGFSVSFDCEGRSHVVTGIAKGAGMIRPNMATMLGFITTDAAVSGECLKQMLSSAAKVTFNRVTIDGDMSTNDTVLALANGAAGGTSLEDDPAGLEKALAELRD